MKSRALGHALLALWLAACAGGGGSGSGGGTITPGIPGPPTPPASADSFRTVEYNFMGALDAIHAADAYAAGYTGAGIIIGIVDFNFDLSSSDVNFHSASRGPDATALALYAAQTGQAPTTTQHGQAVASAAAALKNNSGVHGVAFNAQVLAVDYYSGVNQTAVNSGGKLYHVSDPFTYITSRGARIVSISYGYESSDIIVNPPVVSEYYVTESPAVAVANGALLVVSAGNAAGANPSLSNYDIVDDLQTLGVYNSGAGAFIIAGAADNSGTIASFSDRAGTLKDIYMVAPGVALTLPWNGSFATVSGTSFSAPLISGAAAIVMQRWPSLTARQIRQILFDTATDLGAPGVDDVYGHGMLNLQAAVQPVGTTNFVTATGATSQVDVTAIAMGTAFGDAPQLRAALATMTMFDKYGRDFRVDVSRRMIASPGASDLFMALQQRLGWRGTGVSLDGATSFAYNVRRNPEDGLVPFGTTGGLPSRDAPHQAMFRFTGGARGLNWTAGNGLSLGEALSPDRDADPFATASITRSFSSSVSNTPATFATISLPLDEEYRLSFGVSQSQDLGGTSHPRTPFHNGAQSAAMRLDSHGGDVRFGFELGAMVEEYGLLGTMAAGGLKMTDQASTAWTTMTAETDLSPHWTLRASLTGAATSATTPAGSLIAGVGPIYATSFSLGLAREDLFGDGDALSLAAGQPLRAEHARLTLASATGLDPTTGDLVMGTTSASLEPSGREFDLETAYRFPLGNWTGAANVAYSFDAGHMKGARAVAGLFWITRKF